MTLATWKYYDLMIKGQTKKKLHHMTYVVPSNCIENIFRASFQLIKMRLRPAFNPGFRWPFFQRYFVYLFVYLFVCLFVCLLACLFDVTARVVHNVDNKTSWLSENMTSPQIYLFGLWPWTKVMASNESPYMIFYMSVIQSRSLFGIFWEILRKLCISDLWHLTKWHWMPLFQK